VALEAAKLPAEEIHYTGKVLRFDPHQLLGVVVLLMEMRISRL